MSKTLILSDSGPASLLACACTREAIALGPTTPTTDPLRRPPTDAAVLPFPPHTARLAPITRQAEFFSFQVLQSPRLELDPATPSNERESHDLLAAAHLAARSGYDRLLWPASAAAGDHLDLDRIAQISDRAILISRLVAIDAATHGVPSFHIETPYADFTDRQVADLIADMELPIESCWPWTEEDDAARHERKRWQTALASIGWQPTA